VRTQIRVAGLLVVDRSILVENYLGSRLWTLPGGRLEDNETLEIALMRGFQEELGLRIAVGALLVVNENFFPHAGDVIREYGFYFRVGAKDAQLATTAPPAGREPKFRHAWVALEELAALDFRPAGLIQHLLDPPSATLYVKTRDAELIGGA
jgi:ADP-ribose pyrophosphatase YjhB (NUDIX family)